MRLEGRKRKGRFKDCLCTSEPFSGANRGNKGLTAARQPEQFLGQTTLIKFVWLDSEKAARVKRGSFQPGVDTRKHLKIYYPSADLYSSSSHDQISANANSPWHSAHWLFSQLWNITTRKGGDKTLFYVLPLMNHWWKFIQYFLAFSLVCYASTSHKNCYFRPWLMFDWIHLWP